MTYLMRRAIQARVEIHPAVLLILVLMAGALMVALIGPILI